MLIGVGLAADELYGVQYSDYGVRFSECLPLLCGGAWCCKPIELVSVQSGLYGFDYTLLKMGNNDFSHDTIGSIMTIAFAVGTYNISISHNNDGNQYCTAHPLRDAALI